MELATKAFNDPAASLGAVDAKTTAELLTAAADIALVIDVDGVIRDIAVGGEDFEDLDRDTWIGQPWVETVTVESRPKIQSLLQTARAGGARRWRQVNHPHLAGPDIPVLYSAVQVEATAHVVAVGRDLRAIAALQQRLVEAQMSLERDYANLRHAETRYRMLFQLSGEAVLIVKSPTREVMEANPAAARLSELRSDRLVGRVFPDVLEPRESEPVLEMLAAVRALGTSESVTLESSSTGARLSVSASLFRQNDNSFFLVRLQHGHPHGRAADDAQMAARRRLVDALGELPDGFVLTDLEGRVQYANKAFADLVQVGNTEKLIGQSLEQWLGRSSGVDVNVLIATLREHRTVRLFASKVRGEFGSTLDVEVCGVASEHGDTPCLAFTIRNVTPRLSPVDRTASLDLKESVQPLADLVGQVPLKDLVREASDVVERMCIEAALSITDDNRASAAEILGLSRQSLYVKLRRYGLISADENATGA